MEYVANEEILWEKRTEGSLLLIIRKKQLKPLRYMMLKVALANVTIIGHIEGKRDR